MAAGIALFPSWTGDQLIGHPDIDVWNHAWGLWWWAHSFSQGILPFSTPLISAPSGGTLWFVDPIGALSMLPITLAAGPALAWNVLIASRLAWAGFHARRLAREWSADGVHTYAAGIAFAGSPFLWAEIYNGIAEVCAVGWIPFALWVGTRAYRTQALGWWAATGLIVAAATLSTPYYGIALALCVGPALGCALAFRHIDWKGPVLAGSLTAAAALGVLQIWRTALDAPNAVIQRSEQTEKAVMLRNVVPLDEAWVPLETAPRFESPNEPFRHTQYLRWVIIFGALWAVWQKSGERRVWIGISAASILFSLGERPYLDGQYWPPNLEIRLPYAWIIDLIPGLTISHPARLIVVAHAILCGLFGAALCEKPRWLLGLVPLALLEGFVGSTAPFPAPGSPAAIPALYRRIATDPDPRAVLDLPAAVRRSMRTSVYFWYQTVHQHPVPWWPDVRPLHNGDRNHVALFTPLKHERGSTAQFPPLDSETLEGLARNYGWVVLHTDLDLRSQGSGLRTDALERLLGAPQGEGVLRWWRLPSPTKP